MILVTFAALFVIIMITLKVLFTKSESFKEEVDDNRWFTIAIAMLAITAGSILWPLTFLAVMLCFPAFLIYTFIFGLPWKERETEK